MITLISIGLITTLVLIFAVSLYAPTWLSLVIPIVFFGWCYFDSTLPNYQGYAVNVQFVEGQPAQYLTSTSSQDWIYVTVLFDGGTEPRLVQLKNTPSNQKAIKSAGDKAKDGVSFIKFGSGQASDGSDTKEGDKTGDGSDATDQPPDLQTMDLKDVPEFKKD